MGFFGVHFECVCVCLCMCVCVCVCVYTNVVSENIPLSTKALLIWLMSAFFSKKSALFFFFLKINTFTQSNGVRAVLGVRGRNRKTP